MSFLSASRWIMLAALVAVLVRALVPVGYMPDAKSGKSFQMVICSLDGPKTVTVDSEFDPLALSGEASHDAPAHPTKPPCDFALLQHSPALTPLLDLVTFIVPQSITPRVTQPPSDDVQTALVYPRSQPRAPPVFSL